MHSKIYNSNANYQALSRALRFYFVKDTKINSLTGTKSHVKFFISINHDNGFDILLGVFFVVFS